MTGARPYGPPITYEIACKVSGKSSVSVRFSLLPIDKWSKMTNELSRWCREGGSNPHDLAIGGF